jgi:hypothetical protein
MELFARWCLTISYPMVCSVIYYRRLEAFVSITTGEVIEVKGAGMPLPPSQQLKGQELSFGSLFLHVQVRFPTSRLSQAEKDGTHLTNGIVLPTMLTLRLLGSPEAFAARGARGLNS